MATKLNKGYAKMLYYIYIGLIIAGVLLAVLTGYLNATSKSNIFNLITAFFFLTLALNGAYVQTEHCCCNINQTTTINSSYWQGQTQYNSTNTTYINSLDCTLNTYADRGLIALFGMLGVGFILLFVFRTIDQSYDISGRIGI